MLNQNNPLIKIPVLPQFREILDEVPIPLNKDMPYFPNLDCDACNQAIGEYFKKAGLKGYGAKYLRRHLAEMALDLGQSETWIQQALGHCSDSEQTKRYMRVRGETMWLVCLRRLQIRGLRPLDLRSSELKNFPHAYPTFLG